MFLINSPDSGTLVRYDANHFKRIAFRSFFGSFILFRSHNDAACTALLCITPGVAQQMMQPAKENFLPFTDNMEIQNSLKFSPHKNSLRRSIGSDLLFSSSGDGTFIPAKAGQVRSPFDLLFSSGVTTRSDETSLKLFAENRNLFVHTGSLQPLSDP